MKSLADIILESASKKDYISKKVNYKDQDGNEKEVIVSKTLIDSLIHELYTSNELESNMGDLPEKYESSTDSNLAYASAILERYIVL